MNPRPPPPPPSPSSGDDRFVSEEDYLRQAEIEDLRADFEEFQRFVDDDWPYPDADPDESTDR